MLILSTSAWVWSCTTESVQEYEYMSGLKRYMLSEHAVDLLYIEDKKMLFMDLSCEACTMSKISFLDKDPGHFGISIYVSGDTTNSQTIGKYGEIIQGMDIESKYHLYETGISKPLLMHIKNGKPVKYVFVTDANQNEVLSYLIPGYEAITEQEKP